MELQTIAPVQTNASPGKAWLRALDLTAPIPRNRDRILSTVMAELAEQYGDKPALESERERLTYRGLTERINQYARWALAEGIAKGEVVGLHTSVGTMNGLSQIYNAHRHGSAIAVTACHKDRGVLAVDERSGEPGGLCVIAG